MRVMWAWVVGGIGIGTSALAADIPLVGGYGTPAGCAVEAASPDRPEGETTAVSSSRVRFEGMICPYTGITELSPGAWEATISCARGHEEQVPGTLRITEDEAAGSVSIEVVSGIGPEGVFEACSS